MLVFMGVGSVPATLIVGGDAPFTMAQLGMISLAFATAVIAMVYAIGHISGCQINPAITLALAATGKMPWRDVPGYIAAQVAGAVWERCDRRRTREEAVDVGLGIAAYGAGVGAGQAFFAEAVGTFILAFVVFGAIDQARARRIRGPGHRPGRLRDHHSGGPRHRGVHQPGQDVRPDDRRQLSDGT